MIVCSCNQLTDRQVLESLTGDSGTRPRSPGQVYRCLGCKPDCGRCVRQIRQMFADITNDLANTSCQIGCAVCPGDAAHAISGMIPADMIPADMNATPAHVHAPAAPPPAPWRPVAGVSSRRSFSVPEAQRFTPPPCGEGCGEAGHAHPAHMGHPAHTHIAPASVSRNHAQRMPAPVARTRDAGSAAYGARQPSRADDAGLALIAAE